MGCRGVHTTHHLQFCWSCVVPTPVWPSGCTKPGQVCVHMKDLDTATQPFPWHPSTDAVSLRKVEIARLDHPQGPFTPLAFSDSGRTRCFGRKWGEKKPLEYYKLSNALRSGRFGQGPHLPYYLHFPILPAGFLPCLIQMFVFSMTVRQLF